LAPTTTRRLSSKPGWLKWRSCQLKNRKLAQWRYNTKY
jgi:hypothetical protein